MVSNSNRSADTITLRAPVIVMVLAATAIPVEFRQLGEAELGLGIRTSDFLANVAGYVPLGFVLGGLGLLRAAIAAALISTFAETSQFVMMHRFPSAIDVASNVIGAILGAVVNARWRIRSPGFRINRYEALVAATLAVMLFLGVWASSGDALNARGADAPGTLEAYWKLDEDRGRVALDSSGHGIHGRFRSEPGHVAGVMGGAVALDGATDYIDFGHFTALRLVGSMTISAWINSSSFPVNDAAIVSSLSFSRYQGVGYQLDTTVDRGPRTIGFKLAGVCGDLMARYGATPLVVDTWYHVAGVYDAEAQTLDVYLNGELDNGFLLGSVGGAQRSSRRSVYVGRRRDLRGFEFDGSIDDVRIYSLALTKAEIRAAMLGAIGSVGEASRDVKTGVDSSRAAERPEDLHAACAQISDREDAAIPLAAAAFGVLIAGACIGLWPSIGVLLCLVVSFAAGLFLLPATSPTLPSLNLWTIPLTSLAGGASVALSLSRHDLPRGGRSDRT